VVSPGVSNPYRVLSGITWVNAGVGVIFVIGEVGTFFLEHADARAIRKQIMQGIHFFIYAPPVIGFYYIQCPGCKMVA
jgi:hypothetical protein